MYNVYPEWTFWKKGRLLLYVEDRFKQALWLAELGWGKLYLSFDWLKWLVYCTWSQSWKEWINVLQLISDVKFIIKYMYYYIPANDQGIGVRWSKSGARWLGARWQKG